ncbi:P-loop containing nucleoside triphosphate hydrolase protein [Kickxella alabastrina]|uniref:P-loop containing nucleoside triphosphate hydrolase protein n=1 Tax=Kickxella alabastrina TaxID=61397 RepID=UPI002220F5B1|nr:P-loop containing nucleoside triphosphate hydrolase protein [Kickxella alabastrina]KAI7826382.1 P-loop containing nucleoside triphosphate hydrolase protein [Kickxella alabastrina]
MPDTNIKAAAAIDKTSSKDKAEKEKPAKKSKSDSKDKKDTSQKPVAASAVTIEQAKEFYEKHNISVTGDDSFMPFLDFKQAPFGHELMSACSKFSKPTPIQSACWPVVTAARDVIGIAETGSGKTYAFALPAIHFLKEKYGHRAQKCAKPLVLVVSPTRELAMQTHEQCVEAGRTLNITSVCLYGGDSKQKQNMELRSKKPAIIVATPGRLIDLAENDNAIDLSEVSFLVLDEADRMLDQGFEKDISNIISMLRPAEARQTVMFSATWPKSVRTLASTFLRNPVRVSIGSDELAINERVDQIVEVMDRHQKDRRLIELLQKHHKSRKNRVLGYNCVSIHGDKAQHQRTDAIEQFRSGSIPLLIATDVAARGLDYVINYTFPLTIDDYTHRCGRTARAGKRGVAYTFFTDLDKAHSGELINMLKGANMAVPENLLKFGTTVKKKQHDSYGAFFKDPGSVGPKGLQAVFHCALEQAVV